MAKHEHVDLKAIEAYVRDKKYPENIAKKDKGKKANFRKACKNFDIVDGHLAYKNKRRVIFDEERKRLINTRCA